MPTLEGISPTGTLPGSSTGWTVTAWDWLMTQVSAGAMTIPQAQQQLATWTNQANAVKAQQQTQQGLLSSLLQSLYGNQLPGAGGITFAGGGGGGGGSGANQAGLFQQYRGDFATSEFGVLPFNVDSYIREAVAKGMGFGYIKDRIIHDPRFRQAFPGIFRPDGSLRMTPSQYVQMKETYSSLSSRFGIKLTQNQVGSLISGDVSADEFQFRLNAAEQVRRNPQLFSTFNETLKAMGLAPLKDVTDAFNFVTGKGRREIYDAYETASGLAAARGTGADTAIGGLTTGQVRRDILQSGEVLGLEEAQQKYGKIAEQLRQAGPELQSFGISQGELRIIEFGGPNRAALASKAEQALRQRQAAVGGQRATQQVGLQGNRIVSGYQQEAGL